MLNFKDIGDHQNSKMYVLLIVFLVVTGIALRFIFLESDPPSILSPSAAIYADEGYKALNARNTVLFGVPTPVKGDQYPGHTSKWVIYNFQIWLFSTFGISLKVLRIANILITIATSLMWFILLRKKNSKLFNVFFVGVLVFNPVILFYSRIALYEIPMVFIWTLSVLPFLYVIDNYKKWESQKKYFALIISVLLFLICIPLGMGIKESYLILVASFFMAFSGVLLYNIPKANKIIRKLIDRKYFISVLIVVVIVFYLFLYFFQPTVKIVGRSVAEPIKLFNKIRFHPFIKLQPLSLIMAFGSAIVIIRKEFTNNKNGQNNNSLLFLSIVFITGFSIIWLFPYDPPRYYLLIIFPQLVLTAYALNFLFFVEDFFLLRIFKKKFVILSILLIYGFDQILIWSKYVLKLSNIWLFIKYRLISNIIQNEQVTDSIKVFIIILIIFIGFLFVKKRKIKSFGKKITIFLFIGYILFYLNFLIFRTEELKKVEQILTEISKSGDMIAGDWAPEIAFNLPMKAIYISRKSWNYSNLEELKPDFLMANSHYNEVVFFNKYLPDKMKLSNGQEFYRFKLAGHDFGIWKMEWDKLYEN